jgi:chitin disaccharide deacetylase
MDLWRAMGLEGRRVLIIHHDDLGFTEAQNRAYLALGLPTGSVQTPGAWAPQLRAHPGDLGVHLTLTSECDVPRLRPLTGGASLRDSEGYFWPTREAAWQHVDAGEAEEEFRAQIEALRALGVEPTHLDTHQGTVGRPDLLAVYVRLALEYRLPCMIPDVVEAPPEVRAKLEAFVAQTPLPRVKLVNHYRADPATRRQLYIDLFSGAGPGVYHFIHHAAVATEEGRMLPSWRERQADFEALQDPEVKRVLGEFVPLTYREVRDALRRYL